MHQRELRVNARLSGCWCIKYFMLQHNTYVQRNKTRYNKQVNKQGECKY